MSFASGKNLSLTIGDFSGGYEDLARLMEDAWGQNQSHSLIYTPDFLRSHFEYPRAQFGLAPTIHVDSQIAAFIAGFPRRVIYRGSEESLLVVSFLSVAAQYQKLGLGLVLWSELVKRARQAGYTSVVSYCIEGDPMNRMMLACYKRMGVSAAKIFEVRYLTRIMLSRGTPAFAEDICLDRVNRFLDVAVVSEDVPLRRVWTEQEVQWLCQKRQNVVVVNRACGGRSGFLTGNLMPIPGGKGAQCLLIEDVLCELHGGPLRGH